MRICKVIVTILPLLAVSAQATAQAGAEVTVVGNGSVRISPDTAWIGVGVVSEAETPQEAVSGLSGAGDALIATLLEEGIPAERIQTSQLSLFPVYGDRQTPSGGPEVTGYRAETSVEIRVEDIERLGPILAVAVADGANTLGGLRFGLTDPGAAEDAALSGAITDAMGKAALIAETAGVALGQVVRINEGSPMWDGPRPMMRADMASDVAPPPVAPGEIEITAQVEATFALDPIVPD